MINIPNNIWDAPTDDPYFVLPSGLYFVQVTGVEERDNVVNVRYQILTSLVAQGQDGKEFTEKYWTSPAALPRLTAMLKRAGVMPRRSEGAESCQVDLTQLIGKQLIVRMEVNKSEKDGKSYVKHQWAWGGQWLTTHPEAPKEMLAHLQGGAPTPQVIPQSERTPWD